MKGLFCTKTNISHIILDDKTQIEISIKPNVMQCVGASIFLGFTYFYFFSALEKRSHFLIMSFESCIIYFISEDFISSELYK